MPEHIVNHKKMIQKSIIVIIIIIYWDLTKGNDFIRSVIITVSYNN